MSRTPPKVLTDNDPTSSKGQPEALPELPRGPRLDELPESLIRLLSHRPLLIGDVLAGRFRIEQSLGDGAMGQVFVASNLSMGQRVAVKVLKTTLLADATFRRRFQQEAEAIAAIDHRYVVRFLDLVVGDPTFLVMEYVPGPTLAELLKREKRLAVERTVTLAGRLCRALEAAHRAGVVHRDIKPANIIVTSDGEGREEPKLIDFGLAKIAHAVAPLTRTGQIVGTPAYMSPEQIANGEVDDRSDVFSFGCVLYEMLAGRPPAVGDDDVQVLHRQLHVVPEPVTRFAPEVPRALSEIVARALAKAPADRHQSMRELTLALEALIPQPSLPRTPPPRDRLRLLKLAGALLFGLALGMMTNFIAPGSDGGLLVVVTQPPGASIEVDGRPTGQKSPAALSALAAGAHVIKLHKDGHDAVERRLTLASGAREALDVVLPPLSRQVEVVTVPDGASVFLDGALMPGRTPVRLAVDDELHILRVEKLGYETATVPLDAQPLGPISLKPARHPRGTLFVDADGLAEVWIDDAFSGFTTPTAGILLREGEHRVELRVSSGARSPASKVHLRRGETQRLLLSVPR